MRNLDIAGKSANADTYISHGIRTVIRNQIMLHLVVIGACRIRLVAEEDTVKLIIAEPVVADHIMGILMSDRQSAA